MRLPIHSGIVLMDSEAYDERLRHERAVRKLREAEIEAKYTDKVFTHDEVKARVEDLLRAARADNA